MLWAIRDTSVHLDHSFHRFGHVLSDGGIAAIVGGRLDPGIRQASGNSPGGPRWAALAVAADDDGSAGPVVLHRHGRGMSAWSGSGCALSVLAVPVPPERTVRQDLLVTTDVHRLQQAFGEAELDADTDTDALNTLLADDFRVHR